MLQVLELLDALLGALVGRQDFWAGQVGFNFGAEQVLELFHFNYIYCVGMAARQVVTVLLARPLAQ